MYKHIGYLDWVFRANMNRNDFQKISRLRVKEAKVLLDSGYPAGAYYLMGYAVECALKACIAKQTKRYDFPPKPSSANAIYKHDLKGLISHAELKAELEHEIETNPIFENYWNIVEDWSEQFRYSDSISMSEAQDLYRTCTARKNEVLSWLKKWW